MEPSVTAKLLLSLYCKDLLIEIRKKFEISLRDLKGLFACNF